MDSAIRPSYNRPLEPFYTVEHCYIALIKYMTIYDKHYKFYSSIALHPRKQVLTTCSDDHSWKMWSVPRYSIQSIKNCITIVFIFN